jgi:signal peptidase II
VLASTAALVLVLDVVSKLIVVDKLDHPIELLGGLLTLRLTRNPGAAFGMAGSATVIFTAVAVGVVVVILRTARRLRSTGWALTFGLVLGGALGNLTDRVFRDPGPFRGHVVDWLELPHWPIFNIADSAIVCGAVLAVLLSLRGVGLEGEREGHPVA